MSNPRFFSPGDVLNTNPRWPWGYNTSLKIVDGEDVLQGRQGGKVRVGYKHTALTRIMRWLPYG